MWRACLGLVVAAVLHSQQPGGEPTLRVPRVSRAPRLEDFLNGIPREAGAEVTGFRQHEPGDGTPVSRPTWGYVSYDDHNLFVVFVCHDEPGQIRARMSKREDIDSDDQVHVILDTFHDHHRAYVFSVNPLGIQLDGYYTEGQGQDEPDESFDTLWYSEGRLTDKGYIVWIAIPFKSLRFPNAPSQNWGFALGRTIARANEFSLWPYVTQRIQSFVQQMAALEGLENISPGRNLQLIPYGMAAAARFLDAGLPGFRSDTEMRGGLDAKAVVHDALALDVALNPDFSQVESDEPQVTVNQRFEVFFPEKRPFFIENAAFFDTPISAPGVFDPPVSLFFSRRIVDPQYGVRLTGKLGQWVLGGLAIDDRAPGEQAAPSGPLRGERACIGAVRLRRDFARQSSAGVLVTSRSLGSGFNRVFSLDTNLRLHPNWIVSGQVLRSYTREQNGNRFSGPGYFARVHHGGRHFTYSGRYLDFSPDFRSELGFVRRVDVRQTEHEASYVWRPEGGQITGFGPACAAMVNWNRQGRIQDWLTGCGFEVEFRGMSEIELNRHEGYELFRGIGFRKHFTGVEFRTEWAKWLAIEAEYEWGKSVNFEPASGLSPFSANSRNGEFGVTLRPTPRFRFSQAYLYSRLGTRDNSADIFDNHILRTKVNYQFTRPLSLRVILDYDSVLPNRSLADLERSKRFASDILVTYLVNPGTAFYVGYTDGRENLDVLRNGLPGLRRTDSLVSTGRQFFVKLSYLFRF